MLSQLKTNIFFAPQKISGIRFADEKKEIYPPEEYHPLAITSYLTGFL